MEGLIDEGKELMGEDAEPSVMDAGIIGACQKVEHYEIAGYGTLKAWAEELPFHSWNVTIACGVYWLMVPVGTWKSACQKPFESVSW